MCDAYHGLWSVIAFGPSRYFISIVDGESKSARRPEARPSAALLVSSTAIAFGHISGGFLASKDNVYNSFMQIQLATQRALDFISTQESKG